MDDFSYLLLMATISLVINIVIVVYGMKVKSAENLGLFQALPTLFMFLFLYVGSEVYQAWVQTNDTEGIGFGFMVIVPTMFFVIVSTTILGVVGLVKMKGQGNLFLNGMSILSVSSQLTYMIGFFAYPMAVVVILYWKVKRKRDKAPNIID